MIELFFPFKGHQAKRDREFAYTEEFWPACKKASTDGWPDFKNASLSLENSSGANLEPSGLRQLSNRLAVARVDENCSQINSFNPLAVGNPYG
jgi:hypothetical protein